jgi:hypothetical protein
MKIHLVGAELFHADGRTGRHADRRIDMTKVTVAFPNFANASKMITIFKSFPDVVIIPMKKSVSRSKKEEFLQTASHNYHAQLILSYENN